MEYLDLGFKVRVI